MLLSTLLVLAAGTVHAGTLDVNAAATWSGDYGLDVGLTNAAPAYVETSTPDEEKRYVVRFYFNADAVSLGASGSVILFQALSTALSPIVTVRLQSDGGVGRELVHTVDTDTADASTPDLAVSPGWHSLELDWKAAAGAGANDGALSTRLDDEPTAGLAMLDNDQSAIGVARWGAVVLASSPTGTLWVDDFASRRNGPIGPVLAESLDLDGNGQVEGLYDGVLFLRASFGFTGPALVGGALGDGCRYCTGPEIVARLVALRAVLDIDDNGSIRPLTDHVLLLRHLFGLTGNPLVGGAIGAGAGRSDATSVRNYLLALE